MGSAELWLGGGIRKVGVGEWGRKSWDLGVGIEGVEVGGLESGGLGSAKLWLGGGVKSRGGWNWGGWGRGGLRSGGWSRKI